MAKGKLFCRGMGRKVVTSTLFSVTLWVIALRPAPSYCQVSLITPWYQFYNPEWNRERHLESKVLPINAKKKKEKKKDPSLARPWTRLDSWIFAI